MKEYTASIQSTQPLLKGITPQLIVIHQPFIQKIIYNFVRNSYIAASEAMDYLQLVNEKLLLKLQSNQLKNYSIHTSFKGFLVVAVKNIDPKSGFDSPPITS